MATFSWIENQWSPRKHKNVGKNTADPKRLSSATRPHNRVATGSLISGRIRRLVFRLVGRVQPFHDLVGDVGDQFTVGFGDVEDLWRVNKKREHWRRRQGNGMPEGCDACRRPLGQRGLEPRATPAEEGNGGAAGVMVEGAGTAGGRSPLPRSGMTGGGGSGGAAAVPGAVLVTGGVTRTGASGDGVTPADAGAGTARALFSFAKGMRRTTRILCSLA